MAMRGRTVAVVTIAILGGLVACEAWAQKNEDKIPNHNWNQRDYSTTQTTDSPTKSHLEKGFTPMPPRARR